jgi:hypothetical protein
VICKICKSDIIAIPTGRILSNGSIERRDQSGRRWYGFTCYSCSKNKQKKQRAQAHNAITHRYEKTKNGFLMRCYRNMLSRVSGIQRKKHHLYAGLEILPKDDFYRWSMESQGFHCLFKAWEESGHQRRITPSIDRIDAYVGYVLGNMQWVPFSDNCRNVQRPRCDREADEPAGAFRHLK